MEGFKQFKAKFNVKNAWAAHNDPNAAYPAAETVYQAVKGPGCTLWSLDLLSLALGARGQLPSGSMLSTWRVLKQFTQLFPSG